MLQTKTLLPDWPKKHKYRRNDCRALDGLFVLMTKVNF